MNRFAVLVAFALIGCLDFSGDRIGKHATPKPWNASDQTEWRKCHAKHVAIDGGAGWDGRCP